jgi:Formyl transferase, C-terminal domain
LSHAFDGAERVQLFNVTVLPPSDFNPFLDAKKPGLAHFNKKRETVDVQCANGSQISVGSVKQRNKNLISAKDWWNGVWSSRKEDGFVRLNLVKKEWRRIQGALKK